MPPTWNPSGSACLHEARPLPKPSPCCSTRQTPSSNCKCAMYAKPRSGWASKSSRSLPMPKASSRVYSQPWHNGRRPRLLVGADPFFNSRRARLIALAAQHRLPAIYEWRIFAVDGGLMSYGTVLTDAYAQAGIYAGRILNGEKPGRPSGRAAHQLSIRYQPQNRKDARTRHLTDAVGPRRRGDRVSTQARSRSANR